MTKTEREKARVLAQRRAGFEKQRTFGEASFDEIAAELGVSHARPKQLQDNAFRKLRIRIEEMAANGIELERVPR